MVIAHGGAGGAVAEVLVFLLPLVIFAILSWRAKRAGQTEHESASDQAPERASEEEP